MSRTIPETNPEPVPGSAIIVGRFAVLWVLVAVFAGAPALAQRMVFAHYMLTNQDYQADNDPTQEAKIAAYEREILEARSLGIDGFALNAGGWLKEPYYIKYAAQMFEAAARLNNGFKLMFSADMCCGDGMADVEDMMRRFAGNPRYGQVYYKYDGRFVLTTFAGDRPGVAFWQQVRSDLATGANPSTSPAPNALALVSGPPSNSPLAIFLVPAFFWGGEIPELPAVRQGFDMWKSAIDGSFYWGIAGVPGSAGPLDQVRSSQAYASVVHGGGKLYMAPVCLQFWGANANRYYEYGGGAGMRKMWMDAISVSHPEWVEIITWNDFIEGSYISPIDDPIKYPGANYLNSTGVPLGTVGYFHSHAAAAHLMRYFIQWYKSGKEPAITHDTVSWFYRTQSKMTDTGTPPVARKYGPVADVLYITANLVAEGELRVSFGNKTSVVELPAGSTDVEVPFVPGNVPAFRLIRHGRTVLEGEGRDRIQESPRWNDYYYSTGAMKR